MEVRTVHGVAGAALAGLAWQDLGELDTAMVNYGPLLRILGLAWWLGLLVAASLCPLSIHIDLRCWYGPSREAALVLSLAMGLFLGGERPGRDATGSGALVREKRRAVIIICLIWAVG